MRRERIEFLSVASFLATVLVVMCHADDVMPVASLPISILGQSFSDSNVYNFFMLSGFFVGKHILEEKWWQAALVKRISTLLVPYFLSEILRRFIPLIHAPLVGDRN